MRWLVVVVLVGCSSAPCVPKRLPDCDDCGPGEVRHGLQFTDVQGLQSIAVFDDGSVACLACTDVLYRDARAGARSTLDLGNARAGYNAIVTGIAAGDTLYAVRSEIEQDAPDPFTYDHFLALDESGRVRWKIDPLPSGLRLVAAGTAGPFLQDATTVTAYAAADGSVRWTAPTPRRVAADPTGGAFVVLPSASQFPQAETLQALDPTGTQRWTKTLTATGGTPSGGILVETIAATPSGGLLVTAGFVGTAIDLGEIKLSPSAGSGDLVAALAADGTTQWAHELPPELMAPRALAVADTSLVVDTTVLAIYDANGLVREDDISGSADVIVADATAAPDGTVWLDVNGATITIGSQTYDITNEAYRSGELAVNLEP